MSTNLAMVIFLALTSWTSNSHFRPDQQMLVHGLADGFTHGNQSDGYPCDDSG